MLICARSGTCLSDWLKFIFGMITNSDDLFLFFLVDNDGIIGITICNILVISPFSRK